ncbi:hypothetical protein IEO70_13260 [Bacillus sp. AGMB 02131]|uniref:Uncharacterized protein n=1 Tax=Peribacillus faecalis TaxID=2772559 RepID=A0A927HBT8_9BACI|nr:hypothetical protein [Peribacillus faecalis]MBD3109314.1 hypothetical protein [Peribacillus faecalis]
MKKWVVAVISVIAVGLVGFAYEERAITRDDEEKLRVAEDIKGEMEQKYDIVITKSVGTYSNKVGYMATLTTEDGITFDAWSETDFYMEEVFRKKGLDEWGYAGKFIPDVEKVDLNVGYRDENEANNSHLHQSLMDVSKYLWLMLYVDLRTSYEEQNVAKVEEGIFQYIQQLQHDGGSEVELIVRHKNDSGSYMIIRDEHGRMPVLEDAESVADYLVTN